MSNMIDISVKKVRSPLWEIWDAFKMNRGALGGLIIIIIIGFSALVAELAAPH